MILGVVIVVNSNVCIYTHTHTHIYSARFIRPLSQRTAFSGIWLIFLFVYKYTADTTANILKCVKLGGNEVNKRQLFRQVRNIPLVLVLMLAAKP